AGVLRLVERHRHVIVKGTIRPDGGAVTLDAESVSELGNLSGEVSLNEVR
ncbi:MAG: hypothetical protein HY553_01470, partial [Elusimicrobia bacterium]|nr:hypothetical protein [Elusimicrobiota bacterium]